MIVRRTNSPAGAYLLKRAVQLAERIKVKYGRKTEIIDGYLVEGKRSKDRLTASVLDLPGTLLTFGPGSPVDPGLYGRYDGPLRESFDPRLAIPLSVSAESVDGVPPGVVIGLGKPMDNPVLVAEASAHEADGCLVAPAILASQPINASWTGVSPDTTLWLLFKAFGSAALPSVSIDDATVRQLTGGYDLVARDLSGQSQLRGSPFVACYQLGTALYVAVPVERMDGSLPIGACWVFALTPGIVNGESVMGIAWHRLIELADMGAATLTPAGLGGSLDLLAIAARNLPDIGVEVTVTGRARVVRSTSGMAVDNHLCTGRLFAQFLNGAAPSVTATDLDVLGGADNPLIGATGADPAKFYCMVTGDVLLPYSGGLVEHSGFIAGDRKPMDEGVLSATVAVERSKMVTKAAGKTTTQYSNSLGWGVTDAQVGGGVWSRIDGAIARVIGFASTVRGGQAYSYMIRDGYSNVGAGLVTPDGVVEVYSPNIPTVQLQLSIYQREVTDADGKVLCPFGAVVTAVDLSDQTPKIALAKGSFTGLAFVVAPAYARQGTYYLGNPLAARAYGELFAPTQEN